MDTLHIHALSTSLRTHKQHMTYSKKKIRSKLVRFPILLRFSQDKKSYLHPVPNCKCRECNTFAIVQIHVQMLQAMPFEIKR